MILIQIVYLAFPLVLGGVLQSLVLRWNILRGLALPLDLGRTFRGKRILGDNKTLRGLVVMVLGSTIGMHIQGGLYSMDLFRRLSLLDYSQINLFAGGVALGLGFILAELPNSFMKRQCNVPPGGRGTDGLFWVFTAVDQIDSIVGCLIAAAIIFWTPPWNVVVGTLVLGVLLHMAVNGVFVLMKVKERVL